MEITQLEYFVETARREHITQTADALHITQPALSKSIARLEEDLGVPLFSREGKAIRLNEYGQIALRYAQQILYSIGDLRAELQQLANGMSGSLRIGSSFPAHEPNWLLSAIQDFALRYPDVRFSLRQLPTSSLPAALNEREIDLAISSEPILSEAVDWRLLFTEPMGVILSATHPLAAKSLLSMADLVGERFYCHNANSDVLHLTRSFCAQAGFTPKIQFEGDFPSFIGKAISLGYGISLISARGYLHNEENRQEDWERDIVFRPLRESYCRRISGIAFLKTHQTMPTLQAFLQTLLSHVPEA